jgi:ribosomal protein S27AE
VEYLILVASAFGIVLWLWHKSKLGRVASSSSRRSTTSVTTTAASPRQQIVGCPNCGQRNRVIEANSQSRYRCGSCHIEFPNPFTSVSGLNPEPASPLRPSTITNTDANKISFNDTLAGGHSVTANDLSGVVDAFTGEALNAALGLYQCGKCHVYYHRASFELIQSENAGRCVACLDSSVRLVSFTQVPPSQRSSSHIPGNEGVSTNYQTTTSDVKTSQRILFRNYQPDTVNLSNYREHVGRVVSFTGLVSKVLKSRSDKDYAVMFEDKEWCDGFKMVVFRGSITKFGGGAFLKRLAGRTIFARGLLQKHPTYGYQIVVSDLSMFWRVT